MSETQLNALQASEPTQLLDMLNSPADIRALGFSEQHRFSWTPPSASCASDEPGSSG